MLAVSQPRDALKDDKQTEMDTVGDFPDFGDANLLDAIDFDDLFVGIGITDYSDVLAELSSSDDSAGKEESTNANDNDNSTKAASGDETVSSRKREEGPPANPAPAAGGNKEGKKSSSSAAQSKSNSQGNNKRKVKVDWTPELHRRFVQAVEGLGVDKAVPSRILEIMGIDCLTRHNIASHLQKYRSHRKHMMAREAEAASWSQRGQMYGAGKREVIPWTAAVAGGAPTMGYPPMAATPPPMHHHHHHFRPLHVWGHPSVDQSLMHVWPPKAPALTTWPLPPREHPSTYWHPHHHQVRVPNVLTPGTPCFPQPLAAAAAPPRFGSTVVAAMPPVAAAAVLDILPSKESIDAAIGDVLAKPWLPLPLGLKAPSTDSVMGELQRQGVPNVPPSCA